MEQVTRPLSQRLGQALAKVNADLKLRDRVIAEYRRVASGQITEQQMDPTVRSLLSNLSSLETDLLESKIDLPSIRPGGRSGTTRRLRTGTRRGALALEPYDPDARDGDGDGIVQEGTAWERPATTRILDALGNEIRRGQQASARPTGIRVVDRDGNDIDYKPTYEGRRAGTIGGSTIPEVRPSVKPPEALTPEKPAKKAAAKKPAKPKKETPLADHGARSLKERGLPSTREQYRAATTPPEPEIPEVPEAPEPKTPKAKKPKETPVVDDIALSPGVTLASADRPELEKPEKPRSPFKPSPPPLSGRAQELADEADDDFKKFMELLNEEGYVVFDYETTGLQDGNIPVQIGAVRIRDGKIVERFNVFTNPQRPLSDWSKENLKDKDGNPLTDEWLEGQADLAEAHRQLAKFLGERIIVAHNLPYDGEILDRMMKDADIDYKPSGSIDTLMLLRSAVPKGDGDSGPERHTLGSLADFFDVDLGDAAHTADADSEAAALVLQKAMGWAGDNDSSPDIFDAAKQKELFDEATKKYNADRKEYEVALKQYQSDLANYERAVAKTDEPLVETAEPDAKEVKAPLSPTVEGMDLSKKDFKDLVMNHAESDLPEDFWDLEVKVKLPDGSTATVNIDRSSDSMRDLDDWEIETRDTKIAVAHKLAKRMRANGVDFKKTFGNRKLVVGDNGTLMFSDQSKDVDTEQIVGFREVDPSDPRYDELFSEAAANWLVHQWAASSSMIRDPSQRALQNAARKRFGLETEEWDIPPTNTWGTADGREIAEQFVGAMYEETQKMFADAGIKNVRVYRGIGFGFDDVKEDDVYNPKNFESMIARAVILGPDEEPPIPEAPVSLRSLSSFSSDKKIAEEFMWESGLPNAALFETTVPVERIAATPGSGIGCLGESEVVVFGGKDDMVSVTWETRLNPLKNYPEIASITVDDIEDYGVEEFDEEKYLASLSPEAKRFIAGLSPQDRTDALYDLWYEEQRG